MNKSTRVAASHVVFQLKVTLALSNPPIWRRILVRGDTKLSDLAEIILVVMGWKGYHDHFFLIRGLRYGSPQVYDWMEVEDEEKVDLKAIYQGRRFRFHLEYDSGDCWSHEVAVEDVFVDDGSTELPRCIGGERACPPEDCGGTSGYEEFLRAIGDPIHEEHESLVGWVGGHFDPAAFDITKVNAKLRKLTIRTRPPNPR